MKKIKKYLLPIIILSLLVAVWFFTYKFYEGKIEDLEIDIDNIENINIKNIPDKEETWTIQNENPEKIELTEKPWSVETPITKENVDDKQVEQKIENLRNRLKLKWLIVKWDLFVENNQLPLALKNYIQVHKESPNDETITKRLWDTYFEMNNFGKAYEYYKDLKEWTITKEHLILTLFYSKDLNKILTEKLCKKEIKQLSLDEEEEMYYNNSIECLEDFHICKQNYQDYFKENKDLKNKNLISIKTAINYENSKYENYIIKMLL